MDNGKSEDVLYVPEDVLQAHPRGYALRVEGDCMTPTLVSGDIVFVDPDASPRTYEDLVVLHIGPVLHVCRIAMLNQGIWLFHDNPAHKDVLLHAAEVKVLGTVKWIERANCAAETA